MSSKKSGAGTTILVILIVILLCGAAGAGLYVAEVVPGFNATVDMYLGKYGIGAGKKSAEATTATETVAAPVMDAIADSATPADSATIAASEKTVAVSEPDDEPAEIIVADHTVSDTAIEIQRTPLISTYIAPSEGAARLMQGSFRNWTGNMAAVIPELSFFYPRNNEGTWSYPVIDFESRLIPFIPSDQGMYTIGLANSNGGWINAMAFVAVFEENGELLAVSVDYHADRPQVNLHLREDRMYYIAQGYFTDEEPIPEGTVLRVQESR